MSQTCEVPTPPAAPVERPAAMRFIMIAVLIDMMAIGLMIPVLPHLVGLFTQSKADQAFWFGAVSFSFGIANFLAHPSWVPCPTALAAAPFC